MKDYVIDYALDAFDNYNGDIITWFKEIQSNGCQYGMIGGLTDYSDTQNFYDKHYKKIEELREEYEQNMGKQLQIKGDLKNWFAWFAFDETAYQLANELELEI